MDLHSDLKTLHEAFLRECRYVKNLSPRTIQSYRHCMRMLLPFLEQSDGNWQEAVMRLAETGRRNPGGINIVVRSTKPFLKWLHENGHIDKPVKLRKQKEPKLITPVLSNEQIEKLVYHKPASEGLRRTHMACLCILDGGYRIDELLKLKTADIDWENGLIQVHGKGSRDRKVPMSTDLRKRLFLWSKAHEGGRTTSSQFKGVTLRPSRKWRAQIHDGRRKIVLGDFESELFAGMVYDAAAELLHGDFAWTNLS